MYRPLSSYITFFLNTILKIGLFEFKKACFCKSGTKMPNRLYATSLIVLDKEYTSLLVITNSGIPFL